MARKKDVLHGSEMETRELLGGTEENSVSPTRGSLICPLGKSMIFYKKETEKVRVSGQTWIRSLSDSSGSSDFLDLASLAALPPPDFFSSCLRRYSSTGSTSASALSFSSSLLMLSMMESIVDFGLGLDRVLPQPGRDDSQVLQGRDPEGHLGRAVAKLVNQNLSSRRNEFQ